MATRLDAGERAAAADWFRLHLATLYRPECLDALLERFGEISAILDALHALDAGDSGTLAGLPARMISHLAKPRWRRDAGTEVAVCEERGIGLLRREAPTWPVNLVDLPQMPLVLSFRGRWLDSDAASVAIIGTRRPSPYGVRQTRRFASALAAAGLTVVSGLARGVDGEAHRAAIEAGGRTIAVLGSGLGRVYPRENRALAASIVERGAGVVVSEFPYAASPRRHHFPQRNRLLSGLSLAVVVIEAGERSGTLLTVDWALKQGRPVFVLPGRVEQPEAMGCVRLLQGGAYPVAAPDEVLEALASELAAHIRVHRADSDGGVDGEIVADPFLRSLAALFEDEDAWHPNAICERIGVEPSTLMRELTRLESEGWVRRVVGGRYALARPVRVTSG